MHIEHSSSSNSQTPDSVNTAGLSTLSSIVFVCFVALETTWTHTHTHKNLQCRPKNATLTLAVKRAEREKRTFREVSQLFNEHFRRHVNVDIVAEPVELQHLQNAAREQKVVAQIADAASASGATAERSAGRRSNKPEQL